VTVGGCQIWAVSRMGKNSPSCVCDYLTCAQACVRPDLIVNEKCVFRVSFRTIAKVALSQFV
jgi:hypothetical protein